MGHAPLVLLSILFAAGWPGPLCAQEDQVPAASAPIRWLQLGGELRGRSEKETFRVSEHAENSFANFSRIRIRARVSPVSWFRVSVGMQDSRTLTGPQEILSPMHDNHVDFQHVFVELGAEQEGRWQLRLGRQELAFGDERLVGADSAWDNRAQAFDGARGTVRFGHWNWDVFSATPVEILPTRLDRIGGHERLSGVYGSWSNSWTTVEPYLLWNRQRVERSDLWTPGVRMSAPIGSNFDAVVELVGQRGGASESRVGAWAGYWEVGRRLWSREGAPRAAANYSYASGDKNGADLSVGTFNDLHPAGYNSYGFFEPFAWRNIRDAGAGIEWPLPGRWVLAGGFHKYWLAAVQDGLYVDEGPFVAYNPRASSAALGSRFLFGTRRSFGEHFEAAFGYARFFAAEYLKGGLSLSHSAYIAWTARI